MHRTTCLIQNLFLLALILFSSNFAFAQTTMYWVGGSGSWNDPTQVHWSKQSGTLVPTLELPDDKTTVVFDSGSGLAPGKKITIPPGNWEADNFLVQTSDVFDIEFDGSNGNIAAMNIYGDLSLLPTSDMLYSDPSVSHNVWRFVGTNQQNIETGNQDLSNVEFVNAGTTYNQLSNLKATERIRMFGGTWNSNGHNVNCGTLLFQDSNGSGNPLTKIFNASTSNILCERWESTFAYQSLTVNGDYSIYTSQFLGSTGTQFVNFSFNNIYLEDFPDNPTGGSSVVEHNNFACAYCDIENLIIRDQSVTKLAGIFTVNGTLEVVNFGTTILFNGGNAHEDEVIINGSIKTPKVENCDDIRPIFSNVHNDFTTLTRTSGILKISDAEINNIQAEGGATFQAVNSVLQGSSSGWDVVDPPVSLSYEWVGVSGAFADWDDATNWQLQGGGSNDCIPSITDDVFITNEAKGDIRVPSPYKASCRNFTWTNTKSRVLLLDGQSIVKSELLIAGNFELDSTASITTDQKHELIFSSAKTNDIITNGVSLPIIYFVGDQGRWELGDDLVCDRIDIEGGTIETQDNNITTNYWRSLEDNPKHFIFGSSTITVFGEMMLAELPNNNVTVDKGTSLIRCESLISAVPELYDVELFNSNNILMHNWPVAFNKLILSGSGSVGTNHNMTLNDLVFNASGSELQVDTGREFKINGGIQSNASKVNPGILKSDSPGTRAPMDKDGGHLCVEGYVDFTDIDAVLEGVMHAPLGRDMGNNNEVIFAGGAANTDLFWIGGTNDQWNTVSNWTYITGGCPGTKSPAGSTNLIFDENSFFDDINEIQMAPGTNTVANKVYFYNKKQLTINVPQNFIPDNISVIGGDVRFEGSTVEVQGSTYVGPAQGLPGLLITDMTNVFRTFSFSGEYGIWIVRSESDAIVVDP